MKEARESRRLYQREVAEAVGISLATYARYESGETEPPISTGLRIAEILGVPLESLVLHHETNGTDEGTVTTIAPAKDS